MMIKAVLQVAALALGASTTMAAPSVSDADNALALINEHRASHKVVALQWNNDLIDAASLWAKHLSDTSSVSHAEEAERPNQGEVIAHFTHVGEDHQHISPLTASVNAWLAGGEKYPPGGVIGDDSKSWEHWSQLMWSTSTYIGCGVAESDEGAEHHIFAVCRLSPPGNIVGEAPFPNKLVLLESRQDLSPGPFNGDITHFTTGLGACGDDDTGKGGVAALSHIKMGAQSNGNPLCGRRVRLSANGRSVEATVKDKCMGCAVNNIDVSEDVFVALYDDLGIGRASVTWQLV